MRNSEIRRDFRFSSLQAINPSLRLVLFLTVSLAVIGFITITAMAQETLPSNAQLLTAGSFVEQHMKAGETHAYELTVGAQQFAQILVEQKGVDVGVRVFAPGDALLIEMDSPNGFYGRETVSIFSQSPGKYRIEVYSYRGFPSGDYGVKVVGPREASDGDKLRPTAERLFSEGQSLRSQAGRLPTQEARAKYEEAINKYQQALQIWTEIGELRGQGYALSGIGRSYKARGERDPALVYLGQALARVREAQDVSGEAFVLNEIGALHRDLGDLRDALTVYDDAIKLRTTLGDRYGLAQLHNNLGLAASLIGYQPQAVEHLDKARSIWHDLDMRHNEMNSLTNAAKARGEMGDMDVALSQYQTVLDYCNEELNKETSTLKDSATFLKPFALNGMGLVYDTWGNTETALDYYKKALDEFRANKRPLNEADVLDNIGIAYSFVSDPTQALTYFRQALIIREQLGQPKGWGMTLSNMGYAYMLQGKQQEALQQLSLALPFTQRAGDRRFEAYTLVRIGMAQVALSEPRKALENYEKALAIQQEPAIEDRRGQAITLDKIGEALDQLNELPQALARYGQALQHWQAVGDEQGQALSLYGMAHVERKQLNLANARDRVEEAIRIVEQLRTKVTSRQLQMTYFAEKQDFYELAIDVRMQLFELRKTPADMTDMEAALGLSERARARGLLELLSEARVGFQKGMSKEDADRNAKLELQISNLKQSLFRLRGVGAKDSVVSALASHIEEQDKLLDSARKAAKSRAAEQIQPLAAREIQQLLDESTLLLEYSLGNARSHLWIITPTRIDHYFLAGRKEIEANVDRLRKSLTDREPSRPGETTAEVTKRWREASEQYCRRSIDLSRQLLNPVSGELGNKRLVIVADGGLQYIPFEALARPGSDIKSDSPQPCALPQTLLLNNEVVYQPSASTLALLRGGRQRNTSRTVAIIADPVFDNTDSRLPRSVRTQAPDTDGHSVKEKLTRSLRDIGDAGNADFTLSKLNYSRQEANDIMAVAPPKSKIAVGFDANRAAATSPTLKQYGIVHFATHGIVNDKHPELSGIVLSMVNKQGQPEDGYLTLRDIYNLDLPVHLLVVSACRTGVGKAVRGEGLIGLTRGFMYAGAQTVVVSLWRVDDQATAELMKRFYRNMLGKNSLSPAAALRRAKLEMMETSEGRWRLPYYWAGFVLQGDWN